MDRNALGTAVLDVFIKRQSLPKLYMLSPVSCCNCRDRSWPCSPAFDGSLIEISCGRRWGRNLPQLSLSHAPSTDLCLGPIPNQKDEG